jgi:gamma-glutamyltranspeptidase/glutathione hydrolase
MSTGFSKRPFPLTPASGCDVIRRIPPWSIWLGQTEAIRIDPKSGVREGGADPRGDGLAIGF